MNLRSDNVELRMARALRLFIRRCDDARVYRAGDWAEPGIYRELERGITVNLSHAGPLPDLNSYQPSRFFRRSWTKGLFGPRRPLEMTSLFLAGQPVPAGVYRDVERGIEVCLKSGGPLPDLQTREPSWYRRITGAYASAQSRPDGTTPND